MFPYKTKPFQHQRDILNSSARREFYGLHIEQGLGKSKIAIDNAAFLFMEGKINGMLIIAPNGVHTNWVEDDGEVQTHMSAAVEYKCLEWDSGRSNTQAFEREYAELLAFNGLAIFAVNIDALSTAKGKGIVRSFLKKRRCFAILDESDMIASPGAKRSRSIHGLTALCPYRRNLTGTPTGDGSPFAIYSQFKFLQPKIFGTSFTAFKNYYAEMVPAPWDNAPEHLKVVKRYKNLDRMNRILSQHSVRLTKQELIDRGQLDIPEKLFTREYVELSENQRRMYRELEKDYITQFPEGNEFVVAQITLTRYLRLQQILMGYVPVESDEEDPQPVRLIPGPIPRLDHIGEYFERSPGKIIVWARFRMDLDLIQERYARTYRMVRYDGTCSKDAKEEARDDFENNPECKIILANAMSAGRGLTWNMAQHTAFYSNYFALRLRLQAEDRQHRIGLKTFALYTDFLARGTVDMRIVKAMLAKKSVSDTITGDPKRDWI